MAVWRSKSLAASATALIAALLMSSNAFATALDGGDRRAAAERGAHEPVAELFHDVEHAHPVAMMLLAKRLFDAARRDEAVFWFYEAQLRWRALMFQTSDQADQAQFQRLFDAIGPAINPYAFRTPQAFYSMVESVLAWDTSHPDDFVTDQSAKARSRQGLTDLVAYAHAHEDQIRAGQAEIQPGADARDPYSGSGGAMLSTPRELLTPYDQHRFEQLHIGHTTRDEALQLLGGPEWWSTERDGTSSFGYSYAGPTAMGMTRVLQVTLSFDAHRVFTSVQLPSGNWYDPPPAK